MVVPPTAEHEEAGAWPDGAQRHDAVVLVLVTVTPQGAPRDPQVEVSLGPALDAAAIAAAKRWRFRPATHGGVAVEARIRIAVRFVGQPAPSTPPVEPAPVPAKPPAPPAQVGPPAPADGARRVGDEDVIDVTDSADRAPRSASEVTRDRATLAAAPHRTAGDMLLVVPGVFVTQHGGQGKAYQIFYRGFDAVHGQDLEIWAGGAPVNDVSNLHGQGYADLHFVMPEVVRTLQATPGSYDPRQGDFAVAGTVRLELAYDEPGMTGKASFGSFGTSRYFLAYHPEDAGPDTFAAAEVWATDGFGPSRAADRASVIGQTKASLGPGTDLRILASAYSSHFASAGVLRLDEVEPKTVGRFGTYDPTQGGSSTRAQLVTELSQRREASELSLTSYVIFRSLRLRENYTGFLRDPNGDSQQQLNDDVVLGATGSYRRRIRLLSQRDQIELGLFARNDWIDQSQKRLAITDQRVTANEVDARVRALDVAGYLDVALHPHSRVALRGGVRLDGLAYATEDHGASAAGQARSSQGRHIGKKATAEVELLPGLFATASYGEGFRSPQARSLAEGETTPFTEVISYEGGLRFGHPLVRATAAVFRTSLSDDLVFDQATARNETVPATVRTGVTGDVVATPLEWTTLDVNATYTRAEFAATARGHAAGDLVPYAPQLVVRSDLAATPQLGRFFDRAVDARLGTGISYLARRPLPYSELGHDIFLVDLTAAVRFGEGQIGLDVYNLLDAQWFDGEFLFASNWHPSQGASLVPLRHVTVGAPRTVMVSLALYL